MRVRGQPKRRLFGAGHLCTLLLAASAGLLGGGHAVRAACQLKQIGELPVRVVHNQPLIDASINGRPVTILADTGSAFNMIWRGAAERLNLPLSNEVGLHLYGVGGESRVQGAGIRELKIGQHTFRDVRMLVAGDNDIGGAVALLGQEFFSQADVEFDLAHGAIRLLKPEGCHGSQIVYWSETYSEVPLQRSVTDHYVITVDLNGRPAEAELDTGSSFSVASLAAAASAGVTPDSPGVTRAGGSFGLGPNAVQDWIGTFNTIKIGDETVSRTKLLFADLFGHAREKQMGSNISTQVEGMPRVLIGADFFLSHRVLVAADQGMVYFTYNGGPVFEAGLVRSATAPQTPPK